MKTTKIKTRSLKTLPVITKTPSKEIKIQGDFPLKSISYSKLVKFSTNPLMFKINYLNGDRIESTQNVSGVIGKAFHIAVQTYYGGSDTAIITSEAEAIKYGLEAGTEYLNNYNDGFIKFSSTVENKQAAMEKFVFLFQSYVKENAYGKKTIVAVEEMLEEYINVEWKGQVVNMPVKLQGYVDLILEDKGALVIEDHKTVSAFSDPEKIDGAKMLQAVEYYFLAYAKYGKAPREMIFTEIKMTKNKDGSPQVRKYKIIYAENDLFFDFYFRLYQDMIRSINGEAVFVPNIYTLFDSEISLIAYIHRLDEPAELAKKMKELQVDNITELLKKQIQNASSMKTFMEAMKKTFQSYKSLDYEKMTIQEKIKTKLMEFGILVNFDSEIKGHTVTQYRFVPSIGVKMKTIESHVKDIEQVVGISDIRILAPIPNTSFVGFEIPNKERVFINESAVPQGFNLAIGVDITGEKKYADIREAPHMLVAGSTGSGKSVFINSLITQLQQVTRAELHLFDPKMVELAHFDGGKRVKEYASHHEDVHKSLKALVRLMNTRYGNLKDAGVRNINEYTGVMSYKFVFVDEYGDLIASKHTKTVTKFTGKVYSKGAKKGEREQITETIDISKEIEQAILILAQKGRAAGIHLVISTQRPSVDIVSGVIKANFPTKVAFKMSKAIDSQVLIDENGAEKLIGKGDMLFVNNDGIVRLQGFNA